MFREPLCVEGGDPRLLDEYNIVALLKSKLKSSFMGAWCDSLATSASYYVRCGCLLCYFFGK